MGDAGFFLMTERDACLSGLAASRPAPAPLCPGVRTTVAAGESFTIAPDVDLGDPAVGDGAARRTTALLGVADELVALGVPVKVQSLLRRGDAHEYRVE